MKNLPTLPNDSSFTVQFSISVSKTRAILLFTIKIIEMFELHASIPGMLSDEYQMTIPLKFLIICLTTFLLVHRKSLKKKKESSSFTVIINSILCFHSRGQHLSKRKPLHKKRLQLRQDWQTWPQFHCFEQIWPPWSHVKTHKRWDSPL